MKKLRTTGGALVVALGALFGMGTLAPSALAYPWHRTLKPGMQGPDVKALQIRVAGWYSNNDRVKFEIDRRFGEQTGEAVKQFRAQLGMEPHATAGVRVFRALDQLTDEDGSTAHFAWSEFAQNYSSGCSAKANAYAGTLSGGMVSTKRTKRNTRRLMWRLEALRAKGGNHAIGINSGFRSVPYNQCIGGASASQHLYGDAADNRMASTSNQRERRIARRSQISGIGCYSSLSHNHFDLRIHNTYFPYGQFWWWPERDSLGRELDETGRPCWGEGSGTKSTAGDALRAAPLNQVARALPGAGSFIPSPTETRAFARAGEPRHLGWGD
jgi:zinc D-Ala-D-Ala carboxypeptidase